MNSAALDRLGVNAQRIRPSLQSCMGGGSAKPDDERHPGRAGRSSSAMTENVDEIAHSVAMVTVGI